MVDQEKLVAQLRRNGQSFTADNVENLSGPAFKLRVADLVFRHASDLVASNTSRRFSDTD